MKRQASRWYVAAAMSCLSMLSAVAKSEGSATPGADALAQRPTPKTAQGRPDVSGRWFGSMPLEFEATRTENGSITFGFKGGKPPEALIKQFMAKKAQPPYKPEFQAKLKQMQAGNLNRQDPVFSCGQPGVPRIGAPEQIVQTPKEVVLLYAHISGMAYRLIPLDGRPPRDADPSYYGIGVGRWDGDTLVVNTSNFTTDTWMGPDGNFHSEQMRVIERFRRVGDTLEYNVTIEDPGVLTGPWVQPKVVLTKSELPLEEPYPCDAEKAASESDLGPRQLLR